MNCHRSEYNLLQLPQGPDEGARPGEEGWLFLESSRDSGTSQKPDCLPVTPLHWLSSCPPPQAPFGPLQCSPLRAPLLTILGAVSYIVSFWFGVSWVITARNKKVTNTGKLPGFYKITTFSESCSPSVGTRWKFPRLKVSLFCH